LMNRTAKRPLPDGRMSLTEAYIISITFGVVGLAILYIWLGLACFLLGLFALISYTFIYTPLKQKTPFAVFVGAFPGAIPPLLGYVAATGRFDIAAWLVFGIQFLWQFPHFWAIAWVLDDDYKRAGFKMLPSTEGRDKNSAFQIMVYTFSLIPIVLLPYYFHLTGITSLILNIIFGILFSYQSIKLYQDCSLKSAKNLMFGSFAYLPLVQLAMYLDKI
ncbi:MAG: protoheme IX farnesyltransferase, partial [Bacteroidota bacterium]|jgi:protoheme IX farnesyltransferase